MEDEGGQISLAITAAILAVDFEREGRVKGAAFLRAVGQDCLDRFSERAQVILARATH